MVAVIGDIHGCLFTLKQLVEKVRKNYPGIAVFSVGDLIDRGNFSSEVFEYVLSEGIKFTPGNHEYMFYSYFKEPMSSAGAAWMYNDNVATLISYENRNNLLQKHISIIKELPLYFNLDDCFISHAGVSSSYKKFLSGDVKNNIDLLNGYIYSDCNTDRGVLWTRDILLNLGKLQVVGHTPRSKIIFEKKSNSLYIDTSVYAGKAL
ncbi:MAG: metallophosphoesterase, partial [Bacteroidota bacterium]|nr:metallophosphoesterase [Bacteroidota bacterium]